MLKMSKTNYTPHLVCILIFAAYNVESRSFMRFKRDEFKSHSDYLNSKEYSGSAQQHVSGPNHAAFPYHRSTGHFGYTYPSYPVHPYASYQAPFFAPPGTYYDKRSGVFRPFVGGGIPVLVDYHKRCSDSYIGVKPHQEKHEYYYVCKPDCVIFGKCQNLQVFNQTTGCCTRYPAADFVPVCKEKGNFAIPSDCRLYYKCDSYLKPHIYTCPHNMVFSPMKNECIYGNSCAPTEISNNGSFIPENCEKAFPPCLQNGKFRSPTDCGLYYTCKLQQNNIFLQTRYKCPADQFYDVEKKLCLPQSKVACDCIKITELVYPKPPIYPYYPQMYPSYYAAGSAESYPIENGIKYTNMEMPTEAPTTNKILTSSTSISTKDPTTAAPLVVTDDLQEPIISSFASTSTASNEIDYDDTAVLPSDIDIPLRDDQESNSNQLLPSFSLTDHTDTTQFKVKDRITTTESIIGTTSHTETPTINVSLETVTQAEPTVSEEPGTTKTIHFTVENDIDTTEIPSTTSTSTTITNANANTTSSENINSFTETTQRTDQMLTHTKQHVNKHKHKITPSTTDFNYVNKQLSSSSQEHDESRDSSESIEDSSEDESSNYGTSSEHDHFNHSPELNDHTKPVLMTMPALMLTTTDNSNVKTTSRELSTQHSTTQMESTELNASGERHDFDGLSHIHSIQNANIHESDEDEQSVLDDAIDIESSENMKNDQLDHIKLTMTKTADAILNENEHENNNSIETTTTETAFSEPVATTISENVESTSDNISSTTNVDSTMPDSNNFNTTTTPGTDHENETEISTVTSTDITMTTDDVESTISVVNQTEMNRETTEETLNPDEFSSTSPSTTSKIIYETTPLESIEYSSLGNDSGENTATFDTTENYTEDSSDNSANTTENSNGTTTTQIKTTTVKIHTQNTTIKIQSTTPTTTITNFDTETTDHFDSGNTKISSTLEPTTLTNFKTTTERNTSDEPNDYETTDSLPVETTSTEQNSNENTNSTKTTTEVTNSQPLTTTISENTESTSEKVNPTTNVDSTTLESNINNTETTTTSETGNENEPDISTETSTDITMTTANAESTSSVSKQTENDSESTEKTMISEEFSSISPPTTIKMIYETTTAETIEYSSLASDYDENTSNFDTTEESSEHNTAHTTENSNDTTTTQTETTPENPHTQYTTTKIQPTAPTTTINNYDTETSDNFNSTHENTTFEPTTITNLKTTTERNTSEKTNDYETTDSSPTTSVHENNNSPETTSEVTYAQPSTENVDFTTTPETDISTDEITDKTTTDKVELSTLKNPEINSEETITEETTTLQNNKSTEMSESNEDSKTKKTKPHNKDHHSPNENKHNTIHPKNKPSQSKSNENGKDVVEKFKTLKADSENDSPRNHVSSNMNNQFRDSNEEEGEEETKVLEDEIIIESHKTMEDENETMTTTVENHNSTETTTEVTYSQPSTTTISENIESTSEKISPATNVDSATSESSNTNADTTTTPETDYENETVILTDTSTDITMTTANAESTSSVSSQTENNSETTENIMVSEEFSSISPPTTIKIVSETTTAETIEYSSLGTDYDDNTSNFDTTESYTEDSSDHNSVHTTENSNDTTTQTETTPENSHTQYTTAKIQTTVPTSTINNYDTETSDQFNSTNENTTFEPTTITNLKTTTEQNTSDKPNDYETTDLSPIETTTTVHENNNSPETTSAVVHSQPSTTTIREDVENTSDNINSTTNVEYTTTQETDISTGEITEKTTTADNVEMSTSKNDDGEVITEETTTLPNSTEISESNEDHKTKKTKVHNKDHPNPNKNKHNPTHQKTKPSQSKSNDNGKEVVEKFKTLKTDVENDSSRNHASSNMKKQFTDSDEEEEDGETKVLDDEIIIESHKTVEDYTTVDSIETTDETTSKRTDDDSEITTTNKVVTRETSTYYPTTASTTQKYHVLSTLSKIAGPGHITTVYSQSHKPRTNTTRTNTTHSCPNSHTHAHNTSKCTPLQSIELKMLPNNIVEINGTIIKPVNNLSMKNITVNLCESAKHNRTRDCQIAPHKIPKMDITVYEPMEMHVIYCPRNCSDVHEHNYHPENPDDTVAVGLKWIPRKSNKTMTFQTVN